MIKYPVYQPWIGEKEKQYVIECLDSTWISSKGKFVDEFESKLAELVGVRHAVAMHNGTHPLHIACILSGIGIGDEVIMPAFSYVATGNAVAYCGAKAVFVDINPDTWNIDYTLLEEKINERTKAIIAVDIYGYPAPYNELKSICNKHGLQLIADSAESFGAIYKGKNAGSFGDLSTFSFFGNKTITTGEGGALLTDDDDFADQARQLKNQGNSITKRYFHDVLGYNYRMTNIQAAIGLAQIERLTEIIELKYNVFMQYYASLSSIVSFQPIETDIKSSYWLVSFTLPDHIDRTQLEDYLTARGIETRPFFTSMDDLPYFDKGHFPMSQRISKVGISLPSYPQLTKADIGFISNTIKEFFNKSR